MKKTETIDSLQVLRGIAAIFVLFYHVGFMQDSIGYSISKYTWFGFSGVHVFFVLSGFIIYYTSFKQMRSLTPKEFLLKRFIRIYPIYWVAIAAVLVIYIAAKLFSPLYTTHSYVCELIDSGGLKLIFISLFLIPFSSPPVVGVSWTLTFEVAFYLLFGMLFFRKPKLIIIALALWVAICYSSNFVFHVDLEHVGRYSLMQFLNPVVIDFLYGCLIAILILKSSYRYWPIVLALGISLFIATIVTSLGKKPFPELSFGFPAALIVYGLVHIKSRFPRFLTYLGDASYSVYLFHTPVLIILVKMLTFFKLMKYLSSFLGVMFIILLIISICCSIHSYIENPLLSFCRNKMRPSKYRTSWNMKNNASKILTATE